MNWKVEFYNEKVEEQTIAFPKGILADFLRVVELIEEFGPLIGRPHTAPLGKGLFERNWQINFLPSEGQKNNYLTLLC